MPRDAAATRDRLIEVGQHHFAQFGVHTTPLSRIVAEAGQRNSSALHYHFATGGLDAREGLLFAIIDTHNRSIEDDRRARLDELEHLGAVDDGGLRRLVVAVIEPMAAKLSTEDGREFLSIISQLVDWFDRWDRGGSPEQALRAFRLIEAALPSRLSPAIRRERISRFLEMVSEALGYRARQINNGRRPMLEHREYVDNLVDMAVGALGAG